MNRISSLPESRLYQRISAATASATPENTALLASVTQVVEQATWISDQVVRHMPQYTLHQKTHLFNVLRLMEELIPDETLNQLTPLECALCILAAFTHDLGMAISHDEFLETFDEKSEHPNRTKYLRYRDGFSEEVRQIERLRKEKNDLRAELLEGHIRAEFLRTTHSPADAPRIQGWLEKIAEVTNNPGIFTFYGIDFTERLARIAASHNQGVMWLREHLCKGAEEDAFYFSDSNLALPGLLLRLADYMDFDATRTPRILYRNFGIDNKISVQEWEKHLAITHWKFRWKDTPTMLRYEAIDCKSPVFEKTIREFVAGIDQEVRLVRDELATQVRKLGSEGTRYQLRLPEKVEAVVRPAKVGGKPVYIYRDIEFKLDQDEILQLLMGESLYGDPSLCIRELLQNSLDAVELRRLRLRQPEGERAEKTDFIEEDKLQIHVTWGKDDASGQEFIRVEDNGTGMTRRTLETYFTQIGKSFYRSPEFERERIAMRRAGLLSTPISQFGIGILSCFMLADRLEVKTCPGGKDDHDRAPYNVSISGPGSLFWLTEGTRKEQGTEIIIYLKSEFILIENKKTLIDRLRSKFFSNDGLGDGNIDKKKIDVGFSVCSHILWPTCDILVGVNDGLFNLNDRFYIDVVNPINIDKLCRVSSNWGCDEHKLGDVFWETFDWIDNQDEDSTGTRLRLIFPKNHTYYPGLPFDAPEENGKCRMNELVSFVEAVLDTDRNYKVFVKGMNVGNIEIPMDIDVKNAKIGSYLWIDIRGDATPILKIDRNSVLLNTKSLDRLRLLKVVIERWVRYINEVIRLNRNHVFDMIVNDFKNDLTDEQKEMGEWSIFNNLPEWRRNRVSGLCFRYNQFIQGNYLTVSDRYLKSAYQVSDFHRNNARAKMLSLDPNLDMGLELDRFFIFSGCQINDYPYVRAKTLAYIHQMSDSFKKMYKLVLSFDYINDALGDYSENSWSLLGLNDFNRCLSGASLMSPGRLCFGVSDRVFCEYGYSFSFPISSVFMCLSNHNVASEVVLRYRDMRRVFVQPFIFLGDNEIASASRKYFTHLNKSPYIHVLWPKEKLWDISFAEWTVANWRDDCWTSTWDIEKNIILWAHGAHTPEEMKAGVGKEFAAFVEAEQFR